MSDERTPGAAGGVIRPARRLAARARGLVSPEHAVQTAAFEVTRLETQLDAARERLRRAGERASPSSEPFVRLDYERAPLKIVASAMKRAQAVAKEPFTVAWLEQNIRPGDVVYDIGANVGAYSLVAATVESTASVFAFEPAYKNYAALCDDIVLNDLGRRITPLPFTLGRQTGLGVLRHRRLAAGAARHDSRADGEAAAAWAYEQPVPVLALDDAVALFGLPAPSHVKLDVDGAELDVLAGAERTLRDERLRSLLVEVGDEGDPEALLRAAGFELSERHETPLVWYGLFRRSG